jgi:signal transduction histidine kinase
MIYSRAMADSTPIFAWTRVRFTLAVAGALGLLFSIGNDTATVVVVGRYLLVGFAALLMFGVFERWPRRLPKWLSHPALQLIAIVVIIPPAAGLAYGLTTGGDPDFANHPKRVTGFGTLVFAGLLSAPWIAVGALLRQRDKLVREQAFAFELERSEYQRNALDARLRLLQAQVEPHFLFNTLANVQALVDTGSPQASRVLTSLIAYLRAAVPRIGSSATTLERELELVRAYLDLMQMRMPDRLQYALHIDPGAVRMRCPPMTLLTLIENAVRHGIDPSETGGRIDADVWLRDGRCIVRVTDTGVGLHATSGGLGTGLATLRERLQLAFRGDAQLQLSAVQPHGVCAELSFPAQPEHS